MTSAQQEIIEKRLKRASRRAYFWGLALGLVIGLAAGGLVGYNLGSDILTVFSFGERHQA